MKKRFKILITACISICLAVCVGLFATACEKEPERPETYTVTVTADGKGVAGVTIQFCPVGSSCILGTTDAEGKTVYDIKEYDVDEFEIHVVTGLPNGYTSEYMGEGNEKLVNIKDGNSTTIELKKIDTASFNCTFSASENIKNVQPAISVAGFYEIRSAAAFNFISGETTVENVTSVYVYLNKGDSLKLGAYGETYSYSFYAIFRALSHKQMDSVSADLGSAVVLNLEAGEKVSVKNPEPSAADKRDGTVVTVSGTNAKFTANGKELADGSMLGSGKSAEVTTADGAAGKVIAVFDGVNSSKQITVGETQTFEVELIESMSLENNKPVNKLGWPTAYYDLIVELPEVTEGENSYKITVTSSVNGDVPTVTQVITYGSSIPIAADRITAVDGGYSFKVGNRHFKYTDTFKIEISASGKYSSLKEGDKITYTVLLEKI